MREWDAVKAAAVGSTLGDDVSNVVSREIVIVFLPEDVVAFRNRDADTPRNGNHRRHDEVPRIVWASRLPGRPPVVFDLRTAEKDACPVPVCCREDDGNARSSKE